MIEEFNVYVFSDPAELGVYSAGRHCHCDGLHGADLIVCQTVFFGNAKEIFHSWVTTRNQRRGQLKHTRCFALQYVIVGG